MNKRLEQLKLLTAQEWQLLLSAMILLPLTALALRLSDYKRTKTIMSRFLPADNVLKVPAEKDIHEAGVTARMVGAATHHGLFRTNCLKQALVTWWLLARKGIGSEIRFGVQKKQENKLHAHAWVECGGQPLGETEEVRQQFSAFEFSSDS